MNGKIIISGIRSIEECLNKNPDRVLKLLITKGKSNSRIEELSALARSKKVKVEINPKLDEKESVLAILKDFEYREEDDLLIELKSKTAESKKPIVLALDGITDAQNLGAILRTAAFMGVDAVFIPKDRAASINDAAYRIASGGIEHLQIAQVTNLVTTLNKLKDSGFWLTGFSEHATQSLSDLVCDFACAIIIGNEEKGMRPLVQQTCDYLLKIPNNGGLLSLNASVATAISLTWATNLLKQK